MTDIKQIIGLINRRVNQVLTVAETALPENQFQAFRKFTLDQFGRNGLESELIDLDRKHSKL